MKNNGGFLELDPAVAAVLGDGDKKRREAQLPKAERKSLRRERSKAEARRGKRALYDLPEDLIRQIQRVAEDNGTSASQVAKLALSFFIEQVMFERIDVSDYRVIAEKNPRYEFMLDPNKGKVL